MHSRSVLFALAASTVILPAETIIQGTIIEAAASGAAVQAPTGSQDLDFNRLRELIEQSRNRPAPTVNQQKTAILTELDFNRTPAGIFAVRLEEARGTGNPDGAPPAPDQAPAEAQANQAPDAAKNAKEIEDFRKVAARFRRDVVLGRWDQAREFLDALPKEISQEFYPTLLGKLAAPAAVAVPPELVVRGSKPHDQTQFLPPMEVLGLAAAAPFPPRKQEIRTLAKLLPREPRPPQAFFTGLSSGIRHFGGEDPAARQRAAEWLMEAGFVKEAGDFLPDIAEAREKKNHAALNLIARHRSELHQLDREAAGKDALPLAWELSTSFLTDPQAPTEARAEALYRALSLIPHLGDDTGRQWLEKTFADPKGEGLELLSSLGTLTAQTRENPDESLRLEQLKLQHAAVNILLTARNVDPAAWSGIFTLFANQWAHEAEVTRVKDQSGSRRMIPRYDEWGNLFYTRPDTGYQGQGVRPIGSGQLLECKPDGAWLESIEISSRDTCLLAAARLHLKVKEETEALAAIGRLAAADKLKAKELVRETIRVWASNHNPNSEQDYRSPFSYYYGYNNPAGSIPLTRSKQERNLVRLAELVKGIRALDLGESFHTEFADAFITCHSQAEVWRVEAVESVFGSTDTLDSRTLATLVGKMRLNLAGLWPDPRLQQAYNTKRKDKELQEQVLTGYQAARGVLERALAKKPAEGWRLESQLAALRFEESNYRGTIQPDQQHTSVKRSAFEALASAARNYTAWLPEAEPGEETTEVFETWFFGALGSPSLNALKSHHVAAPDEFAKIKAALESIPGDFRPRHLKTFATTVNNRLANVAPDLKLRYLEGAHEIIGDHEAMRDASEVLGYYRDLITEIELDAHLDGPDQVGGDLFGLQVNIRHTREIEREAGGFQRFLQNQNSVSYAWNFGRPTEDYRDKFEKSAMAALGEHFDVVSLTFHSDKVESLTDPRHGWRFTPYAYFLLKAKGPQVDKVPPLKIDLDFNDTSGYVVLPVTSAEVPIDASRPATRPCRDLKVTLTLDERSHAEKGSLFLEVKATARGLVPALAELLETSVDGFETGQVEDRGLRVVELDPAAEDLAPISEHEWRIEMKPAGGALPAAFRFPVVKAELAAEDGLIRQRYEDVDLQPVGEEVALTGEETPWHIASLIAAAAVLGGAALVVAKSRRRPPVEASESLPLPARINAVSVIGYLRRLQRREGVPATTVEAIEREITALEASHFGRTGTPPDEGTLEAIARRWQAA